ncbi:hypothetical protein Tco_0512236 [Tanacetum coccineum]
MNDLESDDESVDTPLVSPFPHSDNDSDDGEVLNELIEYENVRMLRREKAINSFDGDDLAFKFLIKSEEEFFTVPGDDVGIKSDSVTSPAIFGTIEIHGGIHFAEEWERKVKSIPPYGVVKLLVEVLTTLASVQKAIEKSQGPLTPTATKIFNAIKEKASQCVVVWNGAELFHVNEGRQNQGVLEKSQEPSRLISTLYPTQVGKPGKNRKKSACEVTEMLKLCGPTSASTSKPQGQMQVHASQPARASASASASAKQPQRATSQPASAPTITRQTKTKNVAASAKKTPTRQSQRQKSAKKTPTTK